jgi:hypothetical protein
VIGLDGTIFVGVQAHLWAITPDGKKKWGRGGDEEYPFDPTPVVLSNGLILCVSRYGMLFFSGPGESDEWFYYLRGYGYGSPAVGPTGTIYVPDPGVMGGCGFTAVRATSPLARTPWPRFHGNARNTGNILDQAP